jgi:hypothetical protein
VIGTIKDEEALVVPPGPGEVSLVPYAEPTWLTPGYYSPYFKEVYIPGTVIIWDKGNPAPPLLDPPQVPESHSSIR